MSKQRLYRGKRVNGCAHVWLYGYLAAPAQIIVWNEEKGTGEMFQVIPESVGQSTGELDCNKAEIYDKDWVKASIYSDEDPQILQVQYRKGAYVIDYKDSESDCVIVGEFVGSLKITDTPHLLEKQT